MRRQILTSLVMFVVLSVLLGLLYPLAVYAIGQVGFKNQAEGSLIKVNGHGRRLEADRRRLHEPKYFHPRPSKAAAPVTTATATTRPRARRRTRDRRTRTSSATFRASTSTGPRTRTRRPTDPYCVPVQATDKDGNDVTDKDGNAVYEKNKDGTYVCDPNTVPERVLAYQQFNNVPAGTKVPVDAVTAGFSGLDPDISPENAYLQATRVAKARNLPVDRVMALVKTHTNDPQWGFLGEKTVNVLDLNLALDKLGP